MVTFEEASTYDKMFGNYEKSSNLSESEIHEIKLQLKGTNKTQKQIADEFDIDPSTVSNIKHNKAEKYKKITINR